ncbi:MAG TPA: class I SAM-dependent methyltransferase [Bacteroidales bacterium]|jgi:SAM-dependent methyltransferase|nr:class I SAM-dependent methyltransferase [Bacteroidales bacterium]
MAIQDWNERYVGGDLPWDITEPDDNLVKLVGSGIVPPGKALEIGCGTGTNALWLASQGFSVLGVDIAPEAIEMAHRKKNGQELSCDFAVMDFLEEGNLIKKYDFVFDRGCFHSFDKESDRKLFAANVSRSLSPGGIWASLIGSTEGAARETGPPRRTASEVIASVEPYLEIVELKSVLFRTNFPNAPKAWLCVSRQRKEPAQPSGR